MLDSAHVGDIQGAFGTIGQHEGGRSGLRARALALLAILGPVADRDGTARVTGPEFRRRLHPMAADLPGERHIRGSQNGARDDQRLCQADRHIGATPTVACDVVQHEMPADRQVAAIAASQHGTVTRAQLLACGLGPGAAGRQLDTSPKVLSRNGQRKVQAMPSRVTAQSYRSAVARVKDKVLAPASRVVGMAATRPARPAGATGVALIMEGLVCGEF